MSDSYINKLASIYDKTTLKGIYLFLSFTIVSYVFYLSGIITNEIITDPTKSLDDYFILLSIVSLTTAFLFFLKIENVIIRLYLRLKGYVNGYHRFRNVNYQDSFNSIFISKERKEFVSLLLFWISLIFLLLLSIEITLSNSTYFYLILIIIFFIFILVFDIISVSVKIPLYILSKIQQSREKLKEIQSKLSKTKRDLRVEKDKLKQKKLEESIKKLNRKIKVLNGFNKVIDLITPIVNHLTLTLTCTLMLIFLFFIPFNAFSLFLLVFQFMILISFSIKLKKLQIHIQLVYFMRLFLQEGNYLNQDDDKYIETFIENIQDNHWEEAIFNFNLFLKAYFDPILEHKSIQRATMMNNLQRLFNYFVENKNTGSIRDIIPEDANNVNIHYNNVCFKLFKHLVKTYNSLDDWLKSFIKQGYYPLPKYEKFYDIMDKIESFNVSIAPEVAENMTNINFIEALTNKYRDYDISDFGVFEINGHYYFESAKKVFDRIEDLVGDLNLSLYLNDVDKIDYYKSKKEKKISKLAQRELDSIKEKLNVLKSKGQLEDFLSKSLKEDYRKLESDLKYYKESAPDLLFIESCSRTVGKKFINIFKKDYQKYEEENR